MLIYKVEHALMMIFACRNRKLIQFILSLPAQQTPGYGKDPSVLFTSTRASYTFALSTLLFRLERSRSRPSMMPNT